MLQSLCPETMLFSDLLMFMSKHLDLELMDLEISPLVRSQNLMKKSCDAVIAYFCEKQNLVEVVKSLCAIKNY